MSAGSGAGRQATHIFFATAEPKGGDIYNLAIPLKSSENDLATD